MPTRRTIHVEDKDKVHECIEALQSNARVTIYDAEKNETVIGEIVGVGHAHGKSGHDVTIYC